MINILRVLTGRMSYLLILLFYMIHLVSCEEIVNIDLDYSNPAFVVEAHIYKDSVACVRLSMTSGFFSEEEDAFIDDATIIINDGVISEGLSYRVSGLYEGTSVVGVEGRFYEIEISYHGSVYSAVSYMHSKTDISALRFGKDDSQSILNPNGNIVYSISCEFFDDPDIDNYYMIRFLNNGAMLKGSNYYLLTEKTSNHGSFSNTENTINFSESIFFDGGEVTVELFTIDKDVYTYFKQLDEVLFWRRRVIPPIPYNPASNLDNGALGFFAAWTMDSRKIMLE